MVFTFYFSELVLVVVQEADHVQRLLGGHRAVRQHLRDVHGGKCARRPTRVQQRARLPRRSLPAALAAAPAGSSSFLHRVTTGLLLLEIRRRSAESSRWHHSRVAELSLSLLSFFQNGSGLLFSFFFRAALPPNVKRNSPQTIAMP